MGTKNIAGNMAVIIEHANDTDFTMNAEQVIDFIKLAIATLTEEYLKLGKSAIVSEEQMLAIAKSVCLDASGELKEDMNFICDKEAMLFFYDTVETLMTQKDYRSEAAQLMDSIKKDERFAHRFLFGTSLIPGKSIARLRSRILNQIRKSYNVEVDPYVFNTVLYEHLWSEGTWKVLNSYNYQSTFFQWLSIVASHCIMSHLEENGLIKISRSRTPGNTSLTLKKMSPDYCHLVINDMVQIGTIRDFLCAVYVERIDRETIQKRFDMDDKMYNLTLRASEKVLKTALINYENPYEDALIDRRARKITLSCDFLTIIGLNNASDQEVSPLREVLGITPDDTEFENKVIDFLYQFSNKLGWSDEDKYVWQSRYIKNTPPVEVAENLPGRSRPWVDTRFSKLNCTFKKAIRLWWNTINR